MEWSLVPVTTERTSTSCAEGRKPRGRTSSQCTRTRREAGGRAVSRWLVYSQGASTVSLTNQKGGGGERRNKKISIVEAGFSRRAARRRVRESKLIVGRQFLFLRSARLLSSWPGTNSPTTATGTKKKKENQKKDGGKKTKDYINKSREAKTRSKSGGRVGLMCSPTRRQSGRGIYLAYAGLHK